MKLSLLKIFIKLQPNLDQSDLEIQTGTATSNRDERDQIKESRKGSQIISSQNCGPWSACKPEFLE